MSHLHASHALIPNFSMYPSRRRCDQCVSMRAQLPSRLPKGLPKALSKAVEQGSPEVDHDDDRGGGDHRDHGRREVIAT